MERKRYNYRWIAVILLLSFGGPNLAARSEGEPLLSLERKRDINRDYKVWVKRAGEKRWERLVVYGALVSNLDKRDENWLDHSGTERTLMGFSLCTDDFEEPLRVRVKRKTPFERVEVRPLSYGIVPEVIDEHTVEFRLTDPKQKVSVEFDGDRNQNLFVFPDRPDSDRPPLDAETVLYYGPGAHFAGDLTLRSGQTLYIDEGAIVYAQLRASDAHDIAVRGRGILCGSKKSHNDRVREPLVNFGNCHGVTFSGITIRDSPHWTIRLFDCTDIHVDNVKEICWILNGDGIDFCSCRNVLMENCFFRNYDDNISIKTFPFSDTHTEGILVRNSVFWADCAHNMLVGPEAKIDKKISDITFRDCIILESREYLDPYTGAMAIMISDDGNFCNVTFENIEVEDIRGGKLFSFDFGLYNTRGNSARNITVRNVRYRGAHAAKSVLRGLDAEHTVENVLLQGVVVNDTLITGDNYTDYFETNAFVKNLRFGR